MKWTEFIRFRSWVCTKIIFRRKAKNHNLAEFRLGAIRKIGNFTDKRVKSTSTHFKGHSMGYLSWCELAAFVNSPQLISQFWWAGRYRISAGFASPTRQSLLADKIRLKPFGFHVFNFDGWNCLSTILSLCKSHKFIKINEAEISRLGWTTWSVSKNFCPRFQ